MKYGSCKHGGNLKSCPECNDISCDSTIKLMEENKVPDIDNVTRIEIIDHSSNSLEKGRVFVKYLADNEVLKFSLQDNNKTLKIFIQNK